MVGRETDGSMDCLTAGSSAWAGEELRINGMVLISGVPRTWPVILPPFLGGSGANARSPVAMTTVPYLRNINCWKDLQRSRRMRYVVALKLNNVLYVGVQKEDRIVL